MKKNLLFAGALLLGATANAQFTFTDNFDSYTAGANIGEQTSWTTWSGTGGGADDLAISATDANSPANSLWFVGQGQGGPSDIVHNLNGVYNTGTYSSTMYLKVKTGKNGYFNFQKEATIGTTWALDVNLLDDGRLICNNLVDGVIIEGTYPQGEWFKFETNIDLNTNTWEIKVNDVSQGVFSNSHNQIASLNFYPILNSEYGLDDFSYQHTPYTVLAENGSVNIIDAGGALAGQTTTPTITVRNLGASAMTSFDLTVNYNGTDYTENVTGVNIASLDTYNVTFNDPITLAAGSNVMTVTISNVNGNGADDNAADDSKFITINPVAPANGRVVLGEEGTGSWCGWCPRGTVGMDYMSENYHDNWAGIAVHNGDPMTNEAYDVAVGALISGYPSGLVDRGADIDPAAATLESSFFERVVIEPTAILTPGAEYNEATRELKMSISAEFLSAANSNYKMGIIITEDSITGTGSGYAQSNAYAGGGSGVMGGFENLPSPVPASMMVYNHVARGIYPSFAGMSGFPETVDVGETHSYNFTTTLPQEWDITKLNIIGILIAPDGRIDNAGQAKFADALTNGFVAGNVEAEFVSNHTTFNVYPNPADNFTQVSFTLNNNKAVSLTVFDAKGNKISSRDYGVLSGSSTLNINTSNYAKGMYILQFTAGNKVETKKLLIK